MGKGCGRQRLSDGTIPESLNQSFDAFFECASGRVDLNVCFAVEHFTFGQDALQIGHGVAIVSHRTHVALRNHALHVLFGRRAHPNGEATRQQALERARFGDEASSGRQHETRMALERILETLPFELSKTGLSVKIENQVQGEPALLLDQAVEFDERHFEPLRQRGAQASTFRRREVR